jgi:endonuclease/exonuclease/phosphatase family metal-dependent hydrolase
MKKFLFVFLFTFMAASLSFGQDIKFLTYNLRYDNPNDGNNIWPARRELIADQINFYEPDIFGTQEGLEGQLKWLDENLPDFDYVGIGRDVENGKPAGEHCAIFYNNKKYKVVETKTFWLSENPDVPGKAWDAALSRICTYALFKSIKGGKEFYVFNTHFDHMGTVAREKSAELILSKIKSINKKNYPFVLMGDFNSTQADAPIKLLSAQLSDSKSICKSKPYGPENTFNDFQVCKLPDSRIDFIFTGKNNFEVKKYAVLAEVYEMRYPSDHYPVFVSAKFTK